MSLENVSTVLIAIVTTRVKPLPTFNCNLIFIFPRGKIALKQEKLAMVVQKPERQKTGDAKEQEVLNCEAVVPSKIEA